MESRGLVPETVRLSQAALPLSKGEKGVFKKRKGWVLGGGREEREKERELYLHTPRKGHVRT